MDIFESLENLNVSEECFNDILNIVEEITDRILDDKKMDPDKQDKLYKKAVKAQQKELKQAAQREGKTEDEIFKKRFRDKNKLGVEKHFDRQSKYDDSVDVDAGSLSDYMYYGNPPKSHY